MKFLARSLTLVALLALTGAAQAQTTLDFENLSNPSGMGGFNGQGFSVTQNGFTVTDTVNPSGFISIAPDGVADDLNYTGSVALFNTTDPGVTTLVQDNGNPFTLNSIDLANLELQSAVALSDTVDFTGNVQGGGTVTQSFTLSLSDALQTFTFGPGFTNLLSVTFLQDGLTSQFDNIVLNAPVAAVPEPGTVALLVGMGIAGISIRGKRRR